MTTRDKIHGIYYRLRRECMTVNSIHSLGRVVGHYFGAAMDGIIVLRRRDTKESTCLLRHIMTEKSDLCQYAVCITCNTTLEK